MSVVIVHRSESAMPACRRVAATNPSRIRVVQEDDYQHQQGDTALIRWDCHAPLRSPRDVVDINPVSNLRSSRDKALTRQILAELSPPTWQTRMAIQYPAVLRPRKHKAGSKFFVVRDMDAARRAINRCGSGWYASTLVNKQREFRVFVVQNRVIAVSERTPGDDTSAVAWNLALGGNLANVPKKHWPLPVLTASLEAMRRIGLGWGAVDACIDEAGRAWVFEVNTSPALKNHYTIGRIGLAFGWIDAEDSSAFPLDGSSSWEDFIHPALL